ncbi:MAG: hypothetical protein ACYCO4_08325 [Sulfobacillus sp.]
MAKDMVVLSEREQVRIRILNELLQGALGVEEVSRQVGCQASGWEQGNRRSQPRP